VNTEPVSLVWTATRYFTIGKDGMPGNEIGFATIAWDVDGDIPYPPEMWFAREMLCTLSMCQCPSHGKRGCERYYPGWSYNTTEQLSPNSDVVRYTGVSGRYWIWVLDGTRDAINNREYGKWPD
jgi:hypothetical protein